MPAALERSGRSFVRELTVIVTEPHVAVPELEPLELEEPEPFRPQERSPRPSAPGLAPPLSRGAPRARTSRLLPSEPALFPWLAERLAPGEATVLTGAARPVAELLELLYAANASVGGRVSLLEGANRFNPYRIGELGRALGVDATVTVERIRLARAFTAYQLVALVDRWGSEIRKDRPSLLVGHDLPTLFHDPEIPEEERDGLLRHVARSLRRLSERCALPLLLTLGPDGLASFPALAEDGPRWYDYLRLERRPSSLRLEALRDGRRFSVVPRRGGQAGLEQFVPDAPAEVMAWDAPFRRTVRPWKSG